MKSVAIIGAGITGLTAAFYLKRKGVAVTVFEAANRAGGAIQSRRQNGFLAEFGPNTILETSPKIPQLVRDLNLEARRIYTQPAAKNRYLVRDKKPVAMPSSPAGFFTTKLFSVKSKFAILREPFVPARRDGTDESVAEFVTRRLNREFLDRAINPLVTGIYAGDPEKLSVRHAFPKLFALEQKYGSLIRGQIFGAKDRKKSGEIARNRAKMFSFDEGLQVLTDALAAQIGDALKLNSPVTNLTQTQNGWRVKTSGGEFEFDAVIYCGTAHKLVELEIDFPLTPTLSPFGGEREKKQSTPANLPSPRPSGEKVAEGRMRGVNFSTFSEIRYPPVASVALGFRREDVAHPLDGFGVLIPKIENFKILGTIFSSSLFPNRAPENFVTLTSYVGGERQPELASLPPDKLVELVCADLQILLGVKGVPVFQNIVFHPKAIPQYNVGHGKFKALLDEMEAATRGLFFATNFRNGVSLGDAIVSGHDVAEKILTTDGHG
ncbi:MAG TPA: protoporphyrinogen oxidase [Verrucomicrobiae bacterium]|nr:protoporphyrinogen oxidase [Verrucomicrobiae bacterium]